MSSQTNTNHGIVMATEIVLPGVGEPETLQVRHLASTGYWRGAGAGLGTRDL